MIYSHKRGEPMSLKDIEHMITNLRFPNQNMPCAQYNQVMAMKAKYLAQYGGQSLKEDTEKAKRSCNERKDNRE